MDNPPQLNGYRASHRNKWLYIRNGLLSVQELALLEYYADAMDFDRSHPKFSLVEIDFDRIARVFSCSPNTIRNWHKRLLSVGFIRKTSKLHWFEVVCAPRYINPGFWKGEAAQYAEKEKGQPLETILQNFEINLQPIGEKLQPVVNDQEDKAENNPLRVIGSSKYESGLYPGKIVVEQEVRSDEEYRRIYEEGGYQHLTVDDMKWIDEDIGEVRPAPDGATEADYVEIFFDGDWGKYRNNLVTKAS